MYDCGCIASCFFWLSAHTELLVNVKHSFLQTLRELIQRLSSHDLQGPAAVLFANGFASKDFANVDVKTLTDDIRLSTQLGKFWQRATPSCRPRAGVDSQCFFSAMLFKSIRSALLFHVSSLMHSMTAFVCFRWPDEAGIR